MLNAIRVLALARLQIARNTFWRGKLSSKLGLLALIGLMVFAAILLYSFTGFVVDALRDPEIAALLRELAAVNPDLPADPAPLLAAIPGTVLLIATGLLIFSSFSSLLSSLYLSGDIDMLLVAPVPMRAVFVVKFFSGLTVPYLILLTLLGPVLGGYGLGMGYGPLYHLSAALALLVLPLLPAGLGALLVMAIVRVIPARRAREIVSVLGGLAGISFYLVTQLSPLIGPALVRPGSLRALLATDLPVLPSAWAGRALVAAGEGQLLPLLFYGGLFISASATVFGGCLVLAERLYYVGWSNLANQGGRARRNRNRRQWATPPHGSSGPTRRLWTVLPPESRAILVKDLRLFFRDLRNLQALIFPLALAAIWTIQAITAERQSPAELPTWATNISQLSGSGIAFFICLSLSNALAGTGVSREGKAFWLLKLAPVSAWRLLLGKLTLAYLPFPLVGTLFLAVLALIREQSLAVYLQQLALLLLTGLGCATFGLGLGAAFPQLDWEHPAQQSTWQSGCLSTLFYGVYLICTFGLVAGAAVAGELLGGGGAGLGIRSAAWLCVVAITAGVVWLGIRIGIRGLEQIDL